MHLETASREELLRIIAEQQRVIEQLQAVIEQLQARIAELETRLGRSGGRGMPGLKPPAGEGASPRPRKQRSEGFGRHRATPTERVEHAVEACPTCATALVGGSVKRTREVIELGPSPARIIEHIYLERRCPLCGKRWVPKVDLTGQVMGQQRLGLGLLSLIVTLREEGRLPIQTIQWYLETVHHLHLSVGAIVAAGARAAQQGQGALEQIRERVRASPVANADETGWRENGHNGYVWTFSTLTERYFTRGSREKEMVDQVLGDTFSGVLVSDFYAAYNHYDGLKQRCWAHLLQDIQELRELYPEDVGVQRWAGELNTLYQEAKAFSSPKDRERLAAKVQFERRALVICAPYREDPSAAQRRLSARITRFIEELFVFVLYPAAAPLGFRGFACASRRNLSSSVPEMRYPNLVPPGRIPRRRPLRSQRRTVSGFVPSRSEICPTVSHSCSFNPFLRPPKHKASPPRLAAKLIEVVRSSKILVKIARTCGHDVWRGRKGRAAARL